MIAYAKEHLNAEEVVAVVHKDNIRSRRVFEKLSFECSPLEENSNGLIYRYKL